MTALMDLLPPQNLKEYKFGVDFASAVNLHFACLSQRAESLMSANLILLFELEYINMLQCEGWNSVAVITSVSSSILTGLISTMSKMLISATLSTCVTIRTEALVTNIQVP
jgi:hypothetical protein